GRIEGMRIDALRLQRGQHALARHQRDFALGRAPAEQDADLAEFVFQFRCAHGCSCMIFPGTPLIEPAPIVINTSPSRITLRIVAGISAMSSTNTGSPLPATRSACASVRPSAATIGCSPAAYTSASISMSVVDNTLTKSSNRSRVRV